MTYENKPITCVICKQVIPCVFDDQSEVTVPQVASFSAKKNVTQKRFLIKDKKIPTATHPDTVLIYLTCTNFHGPFAYQINVNK